MTPQHLRNHRPARPAEHQFVLDLIGFVALVIIVIAAWAALRVVMGA